MTPNTPKIATFLMILLPFFLHSTATTTAPSPAPDCTSLVVGNLADCLTFVTPGTDLKKPEGSCCKGLKTVLKTNPDCLCQGFKNSAQFGLSLDIKKALALPSACHLSTPSVSNCGLSLVPGAAPGLSPMAPSPGLINGAPATSIGGSEVPPAPAPGSSGSLALCISTGSLFMSFVAAASLTLL